MNESTKRRSKKVIIIGAGFAGLSCACYLAKAGYSVVILDKNDQVGGRARIVQEAGYTFDMGPSWYWMPDIFDEFFANFGKKTSDYYNLKLLDPGYKVFLKDKDLLIPANLEKTKELFESLEKGGSDKLEKFLEKANYYYKLGMYKYTRQSSLSILEYAKFDIIKNAVFDRLLVSLGDEIDSLFENESIRKILKFPVLFLGSHAKALPLMYSLMNYADLVLGTWYPMPLGGKVEDEEKHGGFSLVSRSMAKLAVSLGVEIKLGTEVSGILTDGNKAVGVWAVWGKESKLMFECDYLVGAGDYEHIEQTLLPKENRRYDSKYWDKRVLSPSSLLFYIGYKSETSNLMHHNLFFDQDFDTQLQDIYKRPKWTNKPLMYVNVPSILDKSLAPSGGSSIFVLIPSAANLPYNQDNIDYYRDYVCKKLSLDVSLIEVFKFFGMQDFKEVYNSFKGNAYGLANTIMQTGPLKPKIKAKGLVNMYFAGQMTVPGPGVPPSILSGQIVAGEIIKST